MWTFISFEPSTFRESKVLEQKPLYKIQSSKATKYQKVTGKKLSFQVKFFIIINATQSPLEIQFKYLLGIIFSGDIKVHETIFQLET